MRATALVLGLLFSIGMMACQSETKVTKVEPGFGNVAGNDQAIIIGDGFKAGMEVRFGKKEARSVVIESSTRMIVKTPSNLEGKVDLIVTRDDGKTFVLRDGFEYRRDVPSGS